MNFSIIIKLILIFFFTIGFNNLCYGNSNNFILDKPFKILSDSSSEILKVVYSPDGKLLASINSNNEVKIWDMNSFKIFKTFKLKDETAFLLNYSPDGKHLVTGGNSYTNINIWNIKTGNIVKTISENDCVPKITYSPDGNYIASGCGYKITIWNIKSGKAVKIIKNIHTMKLGVTDLAYNPNGTYLASTGEDYFINIWNIYSGKKVLCFEGMFPIIYSSNGKYFVFGAPQKTKVLDVYSGKIIKTFNEYSRVLDFSQDNKYLAGGGYLDETIKKNRAKIILKIWDTKKFKLLKKIIVGDSKDIPNVYSLDYSPDGKYLASADRNIKIWKIKY